MYAAPNVSDVVGLLEEGKEYMVPCLNSNKLGWMPVIPLIHQDPELGNPRHHVHYDYRFIDDRVRDRIVETEGTKIIPVLNTRRKEEFTLLRMTCFHPTNRVDPNFQVEKGITFVRGIDDACEGKTFHGRVCPHRGYSLEGISPDCEGVITCPLHGARWNRDGSYAGTKLQPFNPESVARI